MRFRIVIAFCSLAAAGCVDRTAPTEVPAAAAVTPERVPAPAVSTLPPDATVAEVPGTTPAATPAPDSSEVTSVPAESPAPEVAVIPPSNPPAATTEPAPPAAKSAAPASDAVAATPTSPAERPAVVAAPSSPPAPVVSQRPADTLDFTSLGARLRATKAVGVLTKLSVKNQVDDLLAQFREYHKQQGEATLPDLRVSYDMLFQKLLSLVQDRDPPLATDIDRSRAAIWEILSDQRKFIDANLMAGA
jgi:hypothetical protein